MDETDCCDFLEVKRKTILRSIYMVLSTVCVSQTKNLSYIYIYIYIYIQLIQSDETVLLSW
jgi:hypothetical protein